MTAAPGQRWRPYWTALRAIVWRELLKFSQQRGRLASALVRPVLWLAVFAAGFRSLWQVADLAPYPAPVPYDVYILPGLIGMVMLFNGMQSSLAMVYDREMGLMRLLLVAPLPRAWVLACKLSATAILSLVQAACFVLIARLLGVGLPLFGAQTPQLLLACAAAALMLGSLGLLLSVYIQQLENFAGTMNFVIFPMYFMSTALYPLRQFEASGSAWVYQLARWNPFTHAVEWIRFASYGQDAGASPAIVLLTLAACFALACWGYDPQRGFGSLARRGRGA